MKDVLKIIVNIIYSASLCSMLIVAAAGIIYEIVGAAKFEHMLSLIGITNGFECIWIAGLITLFLLAATYFLKKFL